MFHLWLEKYFFHNIHFKKKKNQFPPLVTSFFQLPVIIFLTISNEIHGIHLWSAFKTSTSILLLLRCSGIEPTGNRVLRPAVFTVDTFSAGQGQVMAYLDHPDGTREEVTLRLVMLGADPPPVKGQRLRLKCPRVCFS